jgi:hypothetical protein
LPPRSRIVCAADRPARPPPTTMIWAIVDDVKVVEGRVSKQQARLSRRGYSRAVSRARAPDPERFM